MRQWLAGIGLALTVPVMAGAQGGWSAVRLSDLQGTPQLHYRQNGADFLSTEGDFDGDGKADKAQLVRNRGQRKFAVEVKLSSGKTLRLAEGDIAQMPSMAVAMVGAGVYSTSCAGGRGPASRPCERRNVTLARDAISLFQFDGENRYLYWDRDHFAEVWIID